MDEEASEIQPILYPAIAAYEMIAQEAYAPAHLVLNRNTGLGTSVSSVDIIRNGEIDAQLTLNRNVTLGMEGSNSSVDITRHGKLQAHLELNREILNLRRAYQLLGDRKIRPSRLRLAPPPMKIGAAKHGVCPQL